MHFRRSLVLAGLVLAAAAGPSPATARAGDPPAPAAQDPVAARWDVANRDAAAKLWSGAEDARRNQLFEFALAEARRVLELDPDHRGARQMLGFAKKEGAWVEDANLAAKTPKSNFAGKTPGIEEAAAAERRWCSQVAPQARGAAAAVFALLGEEFAKKGDAAQAEKAFRRALDFDTDQARARAGLKQYRWHRIWLGQIQVRAVENAGRAERVTEETPVEKLFQTKLVTLDTAHFRLQSTLPEDRLAEIAKWLEIVYAVHLTTLGRDPTENVLPAKIVMVLCTSDQQWNQWVNTYVPADREFYRKLDGVWAEAWRYAMKNPEDDSDETRRDHLIHRVVHSIDGYALGLFWPVWVDEALSHLSTIHAQGMTKTWCLAPSKSDYAKLQQKGSAGGKEGWVDEAEWRMNVRAQAAAKTDLSLRTLVTQPFPQLGFDAVFKSWSIVDHWNQTDPVSFRAMLAKLRASKNHAGTIEEHFKKGLEAIEDDWRRWVLRTY